MAETPTPQIDVTSIISNAAKLGVVMAGGIVVLKMLVGGKGL